MDSFKINEDHIKQANLLKFLTADVKEKQKTKDGMYMLISLFGNNSETL